MMVPRMRSMERKSNIIIIQRTKFLRTVLTQRLSVGTLCMRQRTRIGFPKNEDKIFRLPFFFYLLSWLVITTVTPWLLVMASDRNAVIINRLFMELNLNEKISFECRDALLCYKINRNSFTKLWHCSETVHLIHVSYSTPYNLFLNNPNVHCGPSIRDIIICASCQSGLRVGESSSDPWRKPVKSDSRVIPGSHIVIHTLIFSIFLHVLCKRILMRKYVFIVIAIFLQQFPVSFRLISLLTSLLNFLLKCNAVNLLCIMYHSKNNEFFLSPVLRVLYVSNPTIRL